MANAKLRRVVLPALDRRVIRASMQIYSPTAMQDVYISRADMDEQWIVISNPSTTDIDLTGYCITDEDASNVFRFPKDYLLFAGEEMTIWCTPDSPKFDSKRIRAPYLLWTNDDGSLSNRTFFTPQKKLHEVLLLDPYFTEIASLQLTAAGHKTFRVNGNNPLTESAQYSNPTEFEQKHRIYIFSRYWNVISHPSYVAHISAVAFTPLIEASRVLLLFSFVSQVYTQPIRTQPSYLLYGFLADVLARICSLFFKNAILAAMVSQISVILDQFHLACLYLSLAQAYPEASNIFHKLMTTELALNMISLAGVGAHFYSKRSRWHPIYKQIEAQMHFHPNVTTLCYLGKEVLIYLLLVQATLRTTPSAMTGIMLLCIPLFCVSTAVSVARGVPVLLHFIDLSLVNIRDNHYVR
ncbi:hypothetical protein THRCLA_02249 [Thraustotheca clavata]|uniref:LTD domain-containing protein n=1 Tax=Thraustotheca clavata TaxID=74557 RepID=A0A1W0A5W5_9STRA|nr:hypothetical protein THRCLA_02249 [Thraustotheca clavata]